MQFGTPVFYRTGRCKIFKLCFVDCAVFDGIPHIFFDTTLKQC